MASPTMLAAIRFRSTGRFFLRVSRINARLCYQFIPRNARAAPRRHFLVTNRALLAIAIPDHVLPPGHLVFRTTVGAGKGFSRFHASNITRQCLSVQARNSQTDPLPRREPHPSALLGTSSVTPLAGRATSLHSKERGTANTRLQRPLSAGWRGAGPRQRAGVRSQFPSRMRARACPE